MEKLKSVVIFKKSMPQKSLQPQMPQKFIERLKQDLVDKSDDFYKEISIPKVKIYNVLNGIDTFTVIEVIELATKLNQPIDNYVWIAGLNSEKFDVLVETDTITPSDLEYVKTVSSISDKELDYLCNFINDRLRNILEKKLVEKKFINTVYTTKNQVLSVKYN